MSGRAAAYKLARAGLMDELHYVSTIWLVNIPITLFNTLALSLCVYFMVGFALDADRFFFFWLIVAFLEFSM